MRNGRFLIDFHVHLAQYETLLESPRSWFASMYPTEEAYEDACARYADPDRFCMLLMEQGADAAVILAENTPDVTGIASNDSVFTFCKGRSQLIPFCTFDPLHESGIPSRLRAEIDRGFRGLKLYPTYNFFYPNDPSMYPVYETAEELQIPVMFHTGTSVFKGSRLKYGNPVFMDDIAVDFPDLRIILCHGGRGPWYAEAMTMVRLHPNVYIDTAGLPPQKLNQFFPDLYRTTEKFVFGTDWPSVDIGKNADKTAALPLSEDGIRNILGENARRILAL